MDTQFQALPPVKRLRLFQQYHQPQENRGNVAVSLQLPAKKRKESRESIVPATTTYCLPAKKRVWALQHDSDLVSGKPLSPFDLNVEYTPPSDEELKANRENLETLLAISTNQSIETHQQEKEEMKIPLFNENTGFVEISNQEEIREDKEEEKGEEDEDDGILCAICQSTDGDPEDPIVFCDGCDLMVHTTCYGHPLINGVPEGDWFCTQCLVSQSHKLNKPFSCCLCPIKDGAMKPTNNGLWAHVVCALLVPEVFFEDPDGREGIDCSKVPKKRQDGKCYVCKGRKGCVIECSELKCPLTFHITCGLNADLCIEYQEGKKKKETIVAGFCKTHTELWKKQEQTGKFKIVAREKH